MKKNELNFLPEHFSDYQINIVEDPWLQAKIINPFGKDNILVDYISDDDHTPYIVRFEYHHCHLEDEQEVVKYIEDIVNEKIFSIGFFKGEADCLGEEISTCLGGEVSAQELKGVSYKKLKKYIGCKDITKYFFKIRGWSGNNDFDGIFVVGKMRKIEIKKIN